MLSKDEYKKYVIRNIFFPRENFQDTTIHVSKL